MRFLIISPAKNEADYIKGLLDSVVAQTLLPTRWVIVDDGSDDGMGDIVRSYAEQYDWIHLEQRDSSNEQRSGGSKVVRTFYHGYDKHKDIPHDVVMKLDADLTLPADYLESLKQAFEADEKLGLCGGYCEIPTEQGWEREPSASHHVRGALKAYRSACYEEIGGITETWNWDGLDTMQIMHKGWTVRTIEKAVKHHRPTSAAYEPVQHAYRSGEEAYRTGNDLGITMVRALFKLKDTPYLKCSMAYLKGYRGAQARKEPKVVDRSLEQFIRRFQYKRIFLLNRS